MALDDRGNEIEVCLYESYLAQFFIEHDEYFKPLLDKTLDVIEAIADINQSNRVFDRMFFSVFSTVKETNPNVSDITSLKQYGSIVDYDTFFKYFAERCMPLKSIEAPKLGMTHAVNEVPNLHALSHWTLFKNPTFGIDKLQKTLRPQLLFSDRNRGATEVVVDEEQGTNSLGILSEDDTPENLKNYFQFRNYKCRQLFLTNDMSEMAIWLKARHLPVISGASGGIGKTLSLLAPYMNFTIEEYQLLGLLTAASTVALGHHSFFEVMRPLSFLTGELKDTDNLFAFYEQVIPESIKETEVYQHYVSGSKGAILIEDLKIEDEEAKESISAPSNS